MFGLKIKLIVIIAFVFMASNSHAASYTVGTGGDYATLSALYTALGAIVADTTITLVSDITEDGNISWGGDTGTGCVLDGAGYAISFAPIRALEDGNDLLLENDAILGGGDIFTLADGMAVQNVWFKN